MLTLGADTALGQLIDRRFLQLLALEGLIAALAGFLYLGADSLWFNEGITAQVIGLDWQPFWRALGETEGMHGAYYLIMKLWVELVGNGEVMLRTPSVVAAVLAVIGVVRLGRLLFNAQVGLTAGLLLAVNPFFIEYGQEARGHALAVALVTFAGYAFVRMVREPQQRWVAGYILLSALAAYAQLLTLLVVAVQLLSLLLLPRSARPPWRTLLSIPGAIGLLLIPLCLFVLTTDDLHISWIPPSDLGDLARAGVRLTGGRWLLPLVAPLAALPLLMMLRRRLADRRWELEWPLLLTLSWLLVPIGTLFLVSFAVPIFVERYLLITLPALSILVAVGVSQLARPTLVGATLALLLVLSGGGLWRGYHSGKEDWREATAYIEAAARSGDVVIFNRLESRYLYDYYEERLSGATAPPTVVEFDPDAAAEGSRLYRIANPEVPVLKAAPRRRVWLVLSHDQTAESGTMVDSLEREVGSREEHRFDSGIRVLLFDEQGVARSGTADDGD